MPRKKRGNKKGRGRRRDLDDEITEHEKEGQASRMSSFLGRYVMVASLCHLLVVALTIAEAVWIPWWTLYARVIIALRALCLVWVAVYAQCLGVVPVLNMYGSGIRGKIAKSLRVMPTLAIWYILGVVDLYVCRYLMILLDIVSPLIPESEQTPVMALARVVIGILLIVEYNATLNLVYIHGVRVNVDYHLVRRRDTGDKI